MWKDFKEFAMRGNMMDMAVGIIIGGAFGTIVHPWSRTSSCRRSACCSATSISPTSSPCSRPAPPPPPYPSLAAAQAAGAVTLNYGLFVNQVVSFLIVAFAVFMLVKGMNRLKRQQAEAPTEPAPPSPEVTLLSEIRDSLRSR